MDAYIANVYNCLFNNRCQYELDKTREILTSREEEIRDLNLAVAYNKRKIRKMEANLTEKDNSIKDLEEYIKTNMSK